MTGAAATGGAIALSYLLAVVAAATLRKCGDA